MSGINLSNTTIVDDDGFYDASSPALIQVVGGGYSLIARPVKAEKYEWYTYTVQILSGIKVEHEEKIRIKSPVLPTVLKEAQKLLRKLGKFEALEEKVREELQKLEKR